MAWGVFVLVACLTCVSGFLFPEDGPVVQTSYGAVRGSYKTFNDGTSYEEFLGIPFGAPPTRRKRFTKPEPPQSWSGERDATNFAPYCIQLLSYVYPWIDLNGQDSEDCLFLNVFVPNGVENLADTKLPVMVYVYGGYYVLGISDMYPGQELAIKGQVIVVTFNYRVNTLGWLSTGDDAAPGNMGLWDDTMALQWVQDNIANFGGDNQRVIIFGQSAGSASVSNLLLSPKSNHLFQRVIGLSGSAASFFGTTALNEQSAKDLALSQLCPILSSDRMVDCLREKDATLMNAFALVTPLLLGGIMPNWFPVVDGDFIPQSPRDSLLQGVHKNHDILVGHTHHDAAGFVYLNFLGLPLPGHYINLALNPEFLTRFIGLFLNNYENPEVLLAAMKERYDIENEDIDVRTRETTQLATDFLFGSSPTLEADTHASATADTGKRTYLYDFSYRQSFLRYPEWVNGSHVDDVYSVFGEIFMEKFRERFLRRDWDDTDRFMSRSIISYYSNFAYTGNPNEGPHSVPSPWPEFTSSERQYMLFGPNMQAVSQDADLLKRYKFWNEEFFNMAVPRKAASVTARLTGVDDKLMAKVREVAEDLVKAAQAGPAAFGDFMHKFILTVLEQNAAGL